jgi:hypothetical protein
VGLRHLQFWRDVALNYSVTRRNVRSRCLAWS